jgi:hypothetical protein
MSLAGVVAAMVLCVIVNVLAARHFTRWDWTTSKRYTLSPATRTTLHDLPDVVDVWVLLGREDPLGQSVRQLLVAYEAETDKLVVHYVDPDRDVVALEDVRRRFKIQAGVTQDGHVATDAIVVVARGDRHWFLAPTDMVEVAGPDDPRARPREEQALTSAIRQVVRGSERARLCFTAGHGELSLGEGGPRGLGFFEDILIKDNYQPDTIDTTDPKAHEPFKGCAVVIVAGPQGDFSHEEEARLKTYLMAGGSLLAMVSPINADNATGMAPIGLGDALAPFGIGFDEDLVFEEDPAFAIPDSKNIRFYATARPHPVSAGLVRSEESRDSSRAAPRILLNFVLSLKHVAGPVSAVDMLVTSDKAFGVTNIAGAKDWTDPPEKGDKDLAGPLVVAMASERPKAAPSAPHGPRAVVIGTASVIIEQNWREPAPLRGAAVLVENAISWLASKPEILDVPDKPTVAAGIRMSVEDRSEVRRYVLLFMPLAAALLGLAVALRRRSTEGAPRSHEERKKA